MNENAQLEYLINTYADTVLRLSYSYLKNLQDAQDVSQTVFIKMFTSSQIFKNKEHEKAFILRITINACKDILKSSWRSRTCPIEHCGEIIAPDEEQTDGVLWAVNRLDEKYRIVIYLYYYEGYKANEISKILRVPTPTVQTRLVRGRENLKKLLGEKYYEAI